MDLDAALRTQAQACVDLGSAMYGDLLERVADDVAAGGPAAGVLAGHERAPGPSAVALRLAGSVHRLVLERRAGALAAYYPSVGGTWEPEGGWAAFRDLLAEQPDAVQEWLDRPPQTNEVGRAAALMGGLLALASPLPLRLREIGSSAGLNLLADQFRYVADDGRTWGAADSPVVLDPAWMGRFVADLPWSGVHDRVGSDVMPLDVTTTEGRLALTAYVWPDQQQRHERLRGALHLAQQAPPEIRQLPAGDFVDELDLVDGTTTVLWHSVMWQYLEPGEQERVTARISSLGAEATHDRAFAHLVLEPRRRSQGCDHEFVVVLQSWPGGESRILGTAPGHGVPTRWE
ncbi:MAG: DUF2332 domain-containing protein [Nocardioides sp.]